MCLNCGCGEPDARHDDPANITRADLERAAEANGQTVAQAARNMTKALSDLPASSDTTSAAASR